VAAIHCARMSRLGSVGRVAGQSAMVNRTFAESTTVRLVRHRVQLPAPGDTLQVVLAAVGELDA
jgi:hypothetical protein